MAGKVHRIAGHDVMTRFNAFDDSGGTAGDNFCGPTRGQGARYVSCAVGQKEMYTSVSSYESAPLAWTGGYPQYQTEAWTRTYFHVESYPSQSSGNGRIIIIDHPQSHWGTGQIQVSLDHEGVLRVHSANGSGTYETLITTAAAALPRNRWARVECHVKQNEHTSQPLPNPPYISNAIFELKVDGTLVGAYYCSGGDPGQIGYGIHEQGTFGSISVYRFGYKVGAFTHSVNGTATEGYALSIDDSAIGIDGWIGAGYVLDVMPTSVVSGGWGYTVGVNDEQILREFRVQLSSPSASTTTPLDTLVLGMPRLRSLGISTPTRCVDFLAYGDVVISGAGILFGISINGGAWQDFQGYQASYSQAWGGARTDVTIQPDDDVQIRIIKDNNTTERNVAQIGLSVEVQAKSQYEPDRSVQVKVGTYVGNGTQQRIDLGGIVPDLLIISQGSAAGAVGPCFFTKNLAGGTLPPFSLDYGVNYNLNGLCRFDGDGFTVCGGANTLNESGLTFYVIAIHDPSMAVFYRAISLYQHDQVYDYKLPPSHSAWTADMITTKPCRIASPGSDGLYYGSGHAAGEASQMGNPVVGIETDLITSVYPGGWTYGTGSPLSAISAIQCIFAVRNLSFANYTMGMFNYVGNGVGGARISFPYPYDTLTPAAIFVFGITTTGASYTGQFKHKDMPTGSKQLYGTSWRTDSMAGVGAGYFDVGTNANYVNENLQTLSVLVLFEATDGVPRTQSTTDPDPDPEAGGPGPCAGTWGCDWSPTRDEWTFDWPDLVSGLLGVNFGVRRYNAIGTAQDENTFKVNCEQRTFPVAAETREFTVPCEQREFQAE